MYIKTPTFFYHPTLARNGRLFDGSEDRPTRHPGEGWTDSPVDFAEIAAPSADDVVNANAAVAEAGATIARLTEERAVALDRAESAEKTAAQALLDHQAECDAHAKTRDALTAAREAEVAADAKRDEALGRLDEVRTKNMEQETDLSNAVARIAELEAEIAKVDGDGNGKVGGRRAKADA